MQRVKKPRKRTCSARLVDNAINSIGGYRGMQSLNMAQTELLVRIVQNYEDPGFADPRGDDHAETVEFFKEWFPHYQPSPYLVKYS